MWGINEENIFMWVWSRYVLLEKFNLLDMWNIC